MVNHKMKLLTWLFAAFGVFTFWELWRDYTPCPATDALIDWGYVISDVAVLTYVDTTLPQPSGFPYPDVGVG